MPKPVEKTRYILKNCTGRRVLHIGCTNYPNTLHRLTTDKLLHKRIQEVALSVDGIDIDAKGINYMRKAGFSNIYHIDARTLTEEHKELADTYDVVVLGDVIEHIEDPSVVLTGAISRLNQHGYLIISVPNAFYWYAFLRILGKRDIGHPEHVATYTKRNLIELLKRVGLRVVDIRGYYEGKDTKKNKNVIVSFVKWIERLIIFFFPDITSGIICLAVKDAWGKGDREGSVS